ncbi:hypothetical protein GA0070606_4833 [Micromonospora citrea]|uniref:Uncharacterized protein n=1 Tax=Micromonospora citrea TaxID=47855 RepID=A0A1C6VQP0_9ACTN|nr:hypothetical protein GA0070606_4833 [Micromonospora citrea]
MAAAGASPSGRAPVTESGVQVDSSVAHLLAGLIKPLTWLYRRVSMVVVGRLWSAFDALATP